MIKYYGHLFEKVVGALTKGSGLIIRGDELLELMFGLLYVVAGVILLVLAYVGDKLMAYVFGSFCLYRAYKILADL